jgi:uncharacterized protein YunC (DUF1805 family)
MTGSTEDLQVVMRAGPRGRIMAMDSAYHVGPQNAGVDVVVNASYCGVLPARFIGRHRPRGVMSVDCGIGPEGAAIAGLWYLEALNVPTATADVMSVRLGDGVDLFERGVVSRLNRPAADCGVEEGMPVSEASLLMLENDPGTPDADEVTNRTVMAVHASGRQIVCTDSIAFGLPEDRRNVLVTAGHTGRSAVPYIERVRPYGFVCSDGGMGRDGSGVAGLEPAAALGIPGATVSALTARMGDGLSSYEDGVISAVNSLAADIGVRVGMSCADAAALLVAREE